jgi:hypothetical protein
MKITHLLCWYQGPFHYSFTPVDTCALFHGDLFKLSRANSNFSSKEMNSENRMEGKTDMYQALDLTYATWLSPLSWNDHISILL